jgi:choline dehydrogenase
MSLPPLIANPMANWLYASEAEVSTGQRRIPILRGKLLGGSSSINVVFVRGHLREPRSTSFALSNERLV